MSYSYSDDRMSVLPTECGGYCMDLIITKASVEISESKVCIAFGNGRFQREAVSECPTPGPAICPELGDGKSNALACGNTHPYIKVLLT